MSLIYCLLEENAVALIKKSYAVLLIEMMEFPYYQVINIVVRITGIKLVLTIIDLIKKRICVTF